MNYIDFQIIAIALPVAYACTLLGVFLTLRGTALMSDAISHAILPGIVGMFLYTHTIHSPLLLCAATCSGMLTVFLTEFLISSKSLKEDAAIGLVFPLFFSVGIIAICMFARTVHLDVDMVIMGEIIFAPFNTWHFMGYNMGPCALWNMSIILLLNSLFVATCYKELKISTFDPAHAGTVGITSGIIQYILMCLTGITCVGAFDIVGSIVVVALIVGPAATAYLLTKNLSHLLYISLIAATTAVFIGYALAYVCDVSIAGSIATANGFLFLCTLICAPKRGLIAQQLWQRRRRITLAVSLVCEHIAHIQRCTITQLAYDFGWSERYCERIINYAHRKKMLKLQDNLIISIHLKTIEKI
jgi:manganese/zinc/iron transport system permease protein